MNDIPQTERAVQLVGPDKLELNPAKPVADPGAHQVLARVEAVGLCFSDLKLLKQFSQHGRKSGVLTGLDAQTLAEMPNYVPGETPTVPGHEAVIRVVKVGPGVDRYKTGERFIVETDYRWLPTDKSNAAFGYNFEGGLQEYVMMDERVVIDSTGERFLIPAPENLSASSIALEYRKCTSARSTSPLSRAGTIGSTGGGTVVGVESNSLMRSIATRACWYESNTWESCWIGAKNSVR